MRQFVGSGFRTTGMQLGMKESYKKGVANHLGLESCVRGREAADEA